MWISGIVIGVWLWSVQVGAEMGFDPRYERDYNIFNPADRYQADNPLNPANRYTFDVPFAPLDGGTGGRR
jgi:hypothetical protein